MRKKLIITTKMARVKCLIELPEDFKDYIIKFGNGFWGIEAYYKGE